MSGAPSDKPISPALEGMLSVLVGAYPHPIHRDRLCATLDLSREAFRQKLRRLRLALGDDAIVLTESTVALTEAAYELHRADAIPTAPVQSVAIPPTTVGAQFRDLVLSVAEFSKDDARGMLVNQPWISRAIPVAELGQLLQATRPESQLSPYAGEWRNFDILLRSLQGMPCSVVLAQVERSKKMARRYGQKSVYRKAHLLGSFLRAGEAALPETEFLSQSALLELPHYDKLAYISRLFLEYRPECAVRATEWAAQAIDRESEADQAHFWRNATSLSLFPNGRELADEARRRTQATRSFPLDKDSQRCVLVSLAREAIHSRDPEIAEEMIGTYEQLSSSMGWSSWDALEVRAKANILRGDLMQARRYRNSLLSQFQKTGHDQKRTHRMAIAQLDASLP